MPVMPWTQDRRERVREALEAEEARRAPPPRPRVVNTEEAAGLDAPTYRAYRGRVYRVEPIPFERALDLHALLLRYHTSKSLKTTRRALRCLVRLYRRLVIPTGASRWAWPFLPNPFRNASEREVRELADFFWTCRTGVTFHVWFDRVTESLPRSTGSSTSTSSSASGAASPRRGGITSTG